MLSRESGRANNNEVELHDGDRLAMGSTEFLVGIECDAASSQTQQPPREATLQVLMRLAATWAG